MALEINHADQIRKIVLRIAKKYVGQKEKKGNQGFQSAELDKAMRDVGFVNGYAWCMSFVEALYRLAIKEYAETTGINFDELLKSTAKMITPGTLLTWDNTKSDKFYQRTIAPKPGDFIIWVSNPSRKSGHAGVVIEVLANKKLKTIEGNTNDNGSREGDGVYVKSRTIEADKQGLDVLGIVTLKDLF